MPFKDPEKRKTYHKKYGKVYSKKHRKELNKKLREYRRKNRAKCLKWSRDAHKRNKKKRNAECREYYEKHKKQVIKQKRKYQRKHKKEINKRERIRRNKKYATDIQWKLRHNLRTRIKAAISGKAKRGSAVRDLGCTVEFFIKYLENKFYGKMTWGNWGSYWELDHKIPLFLFDLTDKKQFLKAVNFKNLQPLTIKDHAKKSAKELKLWQKLSKKL